jgi:nicotinamidase-related amidase
MLTEYFKTARAFYESKGIGKKIGFGEKAAVIVVDFVKGFTDPECPLGADYSDAVEKTKQLLDLAREKNVPIYFTGQSYQKDLADAGVWGDKLGLSKFLVEGSTWVQLDERLGKLDLEPMVIKKYSSAFFGTSLQSMLVVNRIDTIIVTGCVTSGCIRATVVDGVSLGYRVIVPVECVADRHEVPHEANLFDIDTKYGDVVSLQDVLNYLNNLK